MQAPLDLSVGLRQQAPAVARQLDPDPATIGRVMVAPGEAADDEPVDDAGHAGAADGQLLGQHRRRLRAAAEDSQDAVLGQGQIYRGEGELDLPGEPRHHPPWSRRCFVVHTIRVPNHFGEPSWTLFTSEQLGFRTPVARIVIFTASPPCREPRDLRERRGPEVLESAGIFAPCRGTVEDTGHVQPTGAA